MFDSVIQENKVNRESLCTHWTTWNRKIDSALSYKLTISFDLIEKQFEEYWKGVIERESDPELDDGFEAKGIDLELKKICYPPLNKMLREHSILFCSYVLMYLQTEFIGFIVDGPDNPSKERSYCLFYIENLEISGENVLIYGSATQR